MQFYLFMKPGEGKEEWFDNHSVQRRKTSSGHEMEEI